MQNKDNRSLVTESGEKGANSRWKMQRSGLLWSILAVLVMVFVAFLIVNADVLSKHFGLSNLTSSSSDNCSSSQYGSSCMVSEAKQRLEDEKRWKFFLDTSVMATAVSGAVIAAALLLLSWQISRLTKAIRANSVNHDDISKH